MGREGRRQVGRVKEAVRETEEEFEGEVVRRRERED